MIERMKFKNLPVALYKNKLWYVEVHVHTNGTKWTGRDRTIPKKLRTTPSFTLRNIFNNSDWCIAFKGDCEILIYSLLDTNYKLDL
jgi:hypothetical protein